ncbi:hypothetical protein AXK58_00025 [Tsukamurella tyrosinosolvens]|nr:hypothetical protein AXK58_00025 [Tsukamurella tyrosinosolvens]
MGGISDELRIMGQVRAKLEILPRGNAAESRRVYEECEALLHERSRITTLAITRIHLVIPKNLQAEAKSLERSINGHREEFIKYFGSFQGRNSDRQEFPEMDQAYKDRLNGFVVLIRGYRETTRDLVGKTAVPTNDQMRQKGVSY